MTPQMLAGLLSAHGQGIPAVTGRATATVSQALRPLEALDLPEIYAQHSVLVDFVLYLVLFIIIVVILVSTGLENFTPADVILTEAHAEAERAFVRGTLEAMAMVENPDAEPNSVLDVMQAGYSLNGRLVRAAMVVVSKAPAEA